MPECYPFFYEKKPLPEDHPHRVEILLLTEMIVNYLELVAMQKDNLSRTEWVDWRNFILNAVHRSPVIREFVTNFSDWYSVELNAIIKQSNASTSRTQP